MVKSAYYYWKDLLDKTIPEKVQGYLFFIAFIIIVIASYLTISKVSTLNKQFYSVAFHDRINNISLKEDGFHYEIGGNWYLVKHKIVNYMSVGDSIIKEDSSFHVVVKDSNRIKWNKSVNRNVIFKRDLPPDSRNLQSAPVDK